MSPSQKVGTATEERFLTIAERQETDPLWFRGVEPASPGLDARGVDMIARIHMDDVGLVPVPIQIKSSYAGRAAYRSRHPKNIEAGVLVIVVHKNNSDQNIRKYLFKLLGQVRIQKKNYEIFLDELLSQEMTPQGKYNEKRIQARKRAQK